MFGSLLLHPVPVIATDRKHRLNISMHWMIAQPAHPPCHFALATPAREHPIFAGSPQLNMQTTPMNIPRYDAFQTGISRSLGTAPLPLNSFGIT